MIDLCTFITLTFAGKPVLCEVKYRRKPYGKTISVFGSLQHLPEKSAKIVTKHLYLSFPCGTMTWSQVSSAVVALTPSLSPSVESLGFLQVFLQVSHVRSSVTLCCVESVLPSALFLPSVRLLNIY